MRPVQETKRRASECQYHSSREHCCTLLTSNLRGVAPTKSCALVSPSTLLLGNFVANLQEPCHCESDQWRSAAEPWKLPSIVAIIPNP